MKELLGAIALVVLMSLWLSPKLDTKRQIQDVKTHATQI